MSEVEIHELEENQIEELLQFLRKWGADHPELGEGSIIRWQKCFRFVALHDGRIVGYIGQISHDFKYGEHASAAGILKVGWGVTLVLDMSDDKLRKKAGRGLLSRCENNPPYLFTGVGVVPTIEEPYKRRGYAIRRDSSKMYARFSRPRKALNYLGKPIYYAPILKMANLIYKSRTSFNNSRLRKIEQFDPAWDSLWDDFLSRQYDLYGVRNAEYLNYKLSQPNRSYHVYVHDDGGYIIFRLAIHRIRDLKLVKICDLLGQERAKFELIGPAMKFNLEQDSYGIIALGSVEDEAIYRNAGLYISRPYPIALRKDIAEKMHVTFFDSDLDNLW